MGKRTRRRGGVSAAAGLTEGRAATPLAAAGLDAIEVYHPDHDAPATRHYRRRAQRLGILMTGGSDFHGRDAGRVNAMLYTMLPPVREQHRSATSVKTGATFLPAAEKVERTVGIEPTS